MFNPQYSLIPKLITNISQIERLYGQLEGLRIPKKLEINLERDNLIQSSYISNSIEGNPLSLPEVTNLLLDDRIPVNRDEKEVKNYFEILKSLPQYTRQPISLTTVTKIHQRLMSGVNEKIAGQIRNKRVVVGKYIKESGKAKLLVRHEPPFHQKAQIEQEITELLDWVKKRADFPTVVKAGVFHHHFVFLHPFEDGNGRVCRLVTALIFLENNYLINRYFVLDDYYDIDRVLYSDKLHSADAGDKTEWLEYFSDGVKHSLKSVLAKVKRLVIQLRIEERLSAREEEVLKIMEKKKEITSPELAEILQVSRQQAHNLLRAMVEKGFLDKKGKTKGSYYFVK